MTREGSDGELGVLVLSGLYPRPGNESHGQFVHRQVVALRRRGVDARVLCPVARSLVPFRDGDGFAARLAGPELHEIDGTPVRYAPYRHVPHAVSARLEAALFLRSLRKHVRGVFEDDGPDVVHAFWLFPAGHAAVRLADELGIPSVITALGSDVHTYPERHRGTEKLSRRALREADLSVAVSRALEGEMRRLAGAPIRSEVVYNGLDAARFHPAEDRAAARRRLGLPEAGRGVCFVGRLAETKGVRELTQAFSRLGRSHDDLWLAVVGGGPMEGALREWAAEPTLADRVFMPGGVPHAEVAEWMRAADVFALPSYAEGLPNVVMEAIACGLPAVATDVGGVAEIDADRRALRLIAPRSVDALVGAIEDVLRGGTELREAVEAAGRRVRERFTWERTAEHLHQLYATLSRGHGSRKGGVRPDDRTGRRARKLEGRPS